MLHFGEETDRLWAPLRVERRQIEEKRTMRRMDCEEVPPRVQRDLLNLFTDGDPPADDAAWVKYDNDLSAIERHATPNGRSYVDPCHSVTLTVRQHGPRVFLHFEEDDGIPRTIAVNDLTPPAAMRAARALEQAAEAAALAA